MPFQTKQLFNDDLVSGDKAENLSFRDENDIVMKEDIYSQVFALDDKTENYFISTKLCSKEKYLKYAAKNSRQE